MYESIWCAAQPTYRPALDFCMSAFHGAEGHGNGVRGIYIAGQHCSEPHPHRFRRVCAEESCFFFFPNLSATNLPATPLHFSPRISSHLIQTKPLRYIHLPLPPHLLLQHTTRPTSSHLISSYLRPPNLLPPLFAPFRLSFNVL